jgi:DNA-binding transcriptional LysR family regulator
MELRQLRQFITLADTLNFRRAAERLHMAQPPLSVSIRKLEDELGSPLFSRLNREVRLTHAGLATLENARACVFHADEAKRAVKLAASGLGGQLRIAFVGSVTYRLLPKLIPRYRNESPEVKLELIEASNSQILSLLAAHEVDVGIIRTPIAQAADVTIVPIESDVFVAALPCTHRLARKSQLSMQDFRDEPFVQYTAGRVPGLHAIAMLVFQQAGMLPRVTQEAIQVQTVISLVESGLGIALVPSVCASHASDRIAFRSIRDLPPAGVIGISLAYNPRRETATARRLREMAFELVSEAEPLPALAATTVDKRRSVRKSRV